MRPPDPRKGVWPTPDWLYQPLARRLRFDLDAAASKGNTKCRRFFTQAQDGLSRPWDCASAWCNPPYGQQPGTGAWVLHARQQVAAGVCGRATLLVPVKAETEWWQDFVCGSWRVTASRKVTTGPLQGLWLRLLEPGFAVELLLLRRRVPFSEDGKGNGFFASAVVCFNAPRGALSGGGA